MNKLLQKINNLKKESGQAAITLVIIILTISSVLVLSLAIATYNQVKKLGDVVKSSQSYYVSEGGVEDAVYRLTKRLNYSASYNISLGGGTATVEITGNTQNRVVTSTGNMNSRIRKLRINLKSSATATNIAFNYGVQVGYGGLHMDNNSIVNGNVYSNGPITSAANNPDITGAVYSASGAAASLDQSNDLPMPPPNSITFANSSGTEDAAQSFQVSTTETLNHVDLYIKKQGTPADASVKITNDNAGKPGSTIFASGTLDKDQVTTSFGWVSVNFTSSPQLNNGPTYWLVIDAASNASRYYIWGANASYSSGEAKTGNYPSGTFNTTSLDGYFRLYLGGSEGSIDGIDIGSSGTHDAHANTITGSTATGILYCQTGSGNNKPCNTSQPDPSPLSLPISDANIDQFKQEAIVGGTISGNYTPPGTSSSLGPKEITGNLIIPIDYNLNITGTVWVHGYILINNGANVSLDSDYEDKSGIILSDGYINVGNGVVFTGSGVSGSYMMVLTTNDCNGSGSPTGQACTTNNSAMYINNNAQNVVLYAAKGQLRLKQGANTKEATAYRLYLEENVTVTYETGLASAVFTSGPGAGYEITSWTEIE